MNSLYNIIRNIFFGIFMFFAAKYYGVIGTVTVSIVVTLVADLSFYSWRLHKLGYLDMALWKSIFSSWLVIVPTCFLAEWGLSSLIAHYIPFNQYFVRLIVNGSIFTVFFMVLILFIDKELRAMAQQIFNRTIARFSFSKAVV